MAAAVGIRLLAALCPGPAGAQPGDPAAEPAAVGEAPRLEGVEWLEDATGALGPEAVAALPEAAFHPLRGTAGAGFSLAPRWLRFTLVNPGDRAAEVALVFRFPMMETLELWETGAEGLAPGGSSVPGWSVRRGGLALPEAERALRFEDGGHLAGLVLAPRERRRAMLRAQTRGAGFLGVELVSPWDHRGRALVSQLALAGLGALLALLLLHARYAYRSRRRKDLAALGFLAFQAGHLLIASGTLSTLWSLPPGPVLLAKSSVAALSSFAGCLFLPAFIGTRQRRPVLAAALAACAWASLLAAPAPFLAATGGSVLVSLIGLAAMALSAVASAEALLAGHRAIRIFLPGLTIFCVATTWYLLSLLGLARPSPLVVLAEIGGVLAIALSILAAFVQDDWWEADARHDRLGRQVAERTATLARTEDALRVEEGERRQAEERFRLAFETNPDAVFISRAASGEVLAANPGFLRLQGLRLEEVLGRRTSDLGFWEDGGRESFVARLRRDGDIRDLEVPLRLPGGAVRTLHLSASVLDQDGEALLLATARDVTDARAAAAARSRLEADLQQAQRLEALGRLAAGVAHDFNNLLAVLSADVGLALEEVPASGEARAALEDARATVQRAAELTRQLLTFTRRRTGSPRPVAVDGLVRGMERLLRRAVGEGAVLVVRLAEALPVLEADPGQLEQVLLNLVVNARDAVSPGGRITLDASVVERTVEPARPAGPWLRLSVEDDGAGMDEATRQRIFEPFFTTKPEGQGTGLGLATVYGVVQQHGGSISVRSAPGRGSTFEVFLPIPAASQPLEATAAKTARASSLLV